MMELFLNFKNRAWWKGPLQSSRMKIIAENCQKEQFLKQSVEKNSVLIKFIKEIRYLENVHGGTFLKNK